MTIAKKIVNLLIILSLSLSTLLQNTFAADKISFTDIDGSEYYAESAAFLAESKILTGYEDGSFGADKLITRAETAAVVCRMLGKDAEAKATNTESGFSDVAVSHWSNGYISVAAAEKIISGDGNGTFRPEDNVKYEEAIKMIVCTLGFGDDITPNPTDWSKPYLDIAKEKGISDNLKGTKGQAATRGDIAVMVFNGLKNTSSPEPSVKENIANDRPWREHPEDFKLLAFTFDDDPYQEGISDSAAVRIADIFKENDGTCTYFLIGKNISKYGTAIPNYVKNLGNELASHSYSHTNLSNMSKTELMDDMLMNYFLFRDNFGETPKFFRGAGYSTNPELWKILEDEGMIGAVARSHTPGNDWIGGDCTTESIIIYFDCADLNDGAIIGMHSPNPIVPEALEVVLPKLYEKGYRFCTLSELFEYRNIELDGVPEDNINGIKKTEDGYSVY